MSTFNRYITEDRRLVILRVLDASNGYACNSYLLQTMLESQGHTVSLDRLYQDLAWLAEQELLRTEQVGEMCVAHLLPRGVDVAHGRSTVPGIKRPRPE